MCQMCDDTVTLLELTRPENGGGVVEIRLLSGKPPVLIRDDKRYVLKKDG